MDKMALLTGLAIIAQLVAAEPVTAGNPVSAPGTKNSQQGPAAKKQGKDDEFARQTLTSPVEMPDLPQYTGKATFVFGKAMPNTIHGPSYVQRFDVKEKPADVYAWYQSILSNDPWHVNRITPSLIDSSHKSGHTCIVTVSGTTSLPAPQKNPADSRTQAPLQHGSQVTIYFHIIDMQRFH